MSDLIFELEHDSARANRINMYNQLAHDPGFLPKDLARYEGATTDSVAAAAARYLPFDRRIVVVVTPDQGAPVSGVLRATTATPVPMSVPVPVPATPPRGATR